MSEETLEKVVVATSKELVVLNEDLIKQEREKVNEKKIKALKISGVLSVIIFLEIIIFFGFKGVVFFTALALYLLHEFIWINLQKRYSKFPLHPNGMKPVHAFVEKEDYIIVCNGKVVKEEFGVPVKYILDNYDEADDGEDVILDLTTEDKAFEEELNNVIKQYEEAQDGS